MIAASPSGPLLLRAGAADCEIWPEAGGSIGRWRISGQDMLRPANPPGSSDIFPLTMASFPLVPYSNRIGFCQFNWGGRTYRLKPNFPPEQHALHGTGWTATWLHTQLNAHEIILRYAHTANAHWPWPFEAEQHVSLTPDRLSIHMVARNLADVPVPLAFGHHPYFDSTGASLSFGADALWRTGDDGLPDHAVRPAGQDDFTAGAAVAGLTLDNCYTGWDGKARISWADRPLAVDITSDMTAAVVYIPAAERFFCFEPVPHLINALNMPGHEPQMPVVAPGESFEAEILFQASPA
jgi:aldose 1-epimerase